MCVDETIRAVAAQGGGVAVAVAVAVASGRSCRRTERHREM